MKLNAKRTFAKGILGTAAMTGALGLGAVGLGSGIAQADPPGIPVPPIPPIPGSAIPSVPAMPNVPMPNVPNIPMSNLPDDLIPWDGPNINPAWVPGMPPGQNPFGPPGQVKKWLTLPLPDGTVLNPNPFLNMPPGQWGNVVLDPDEFTVTLPDGEVVGLVWDMAEQAWGYLTDDRFVKLDFNFQADAEAAG